MSFVGPTGIFKTEFVKKKTSLKSENLRVTFEMEWPLLALCDERVTCVICVHVCMNEKEVNCTIGYFF